jgi:hypothetical protein
MLCCKGRGNLVAKFQLKVTGLVLLSSWSTSSFAWCYFSPAFATLELFFMFYLCFCPSIAVVGGGHVHAVNTPVLGFVVGAPVKFLPVMVDSRTFLGNAPRFGTILGSLLGSVCTATATLVAMICLGGILDLLLKFVEFLGGLLQLSGEGNNLCVLVVAVHPSPIGNHVLVHLVETGENGGLFGHLFHDPAILQGIYKGDEFLGWGGQACVEDVGNEVTLSVGEYTRLGVDLLKNLEHLGGKVADFVLHVGPEFDRIKLNFKMPNFNDGLGLGDLDDFSKKNEPAEDDGRGFLVLKGELMLVVKKGLEGVLGDVVPDGK